MTYRDCSIGRGFTGTNYVKSVFAKPGKNGRWQACMYTLMLGYRIEKYARLAQCQESTSQLGIFPKERDEK